MIYKLEKNWLSKVVEFKATIDLSKSENIPLKKVIEFIEKYKENSLTQRFSQICINYILFRRQHPFTYLKKIPLKLIKSSFNEVDANSLKGIEFTKKMDSTIKELFAFEKLINTGYEYNEKVPKKPIEDDFYLSDDNQNKYAFEVKSKQENEFCTFYLSDYLRGKMYLHNYKKNITICNFNIKIKKDYEKKIEKILSFIEPKVLIDDLIINTIDCKKHKLCVVYDKQIIDFKENEVDIKVTQTKGDLEIVFKSQDWNLKLRIEENVTNQDITITGYKRIMSDFTKTIVTTEFGKYLECKLSNLLIQYTNDKKSNSRENDEFVGFLYLHIPRNWEFTSSLIRSFEELLKELKIKQKIYFSVYCFLYNSEKKNELIII